MSGYIGKDGLDISNNFTSKTILTSDNNWSNSKSFYRLTTACAVVSVSTSLTDIPNTIIITASNLTLTFPTVMPSGIILNIRRTIAGTTTFSGPTFKTVANANMTTSTSLIISLVSYNNTWWMLI